MRNISLTLAYDGTNYCGWQVQANGPSIQAELERAIEKLTGHRSRVLSAGRTDSGVHALGQIANFHTESHIPGDKFRPALQQFLPVDIVVLESREIAIDFHATFSAKRKRYRYVIHQGQVAFPFLRRYAYHLSAELDVAAMHAAAQRLLGTHNFRSFETDWPNKATSVRTVFEIEFGRHSHWPLWTSTTLLAPEGGEGLGVRGDRSVNSPLSPRGRGIGREGPTAPFGDFISMDIVADGFLYNMVRTIVGTLINVGRNTWTAADVERILRAQTRSAAGATAPACGLYLVHVDYGDAWHAVSESSSAVIEVPVP